MSLDIAADETLVVDRADTLRLQKPAAAKRSGPVLEVLDHPAVGRDARVVDPENVPDVEQEDGPFRVACIDQLGDVSGVEKRRDSGDQEKRRLWL
jgi:hypothetical protein